MTYLSEVQEAMRMLADDPRTLFVGQAVRYSGQAMHQTLVHVPMEKRIEMPVIEDFQAGFCTGLALEGYIPVCIFPRFDFLLIAANQIVNHLDKIPLMTDFRPKVILRTSVGATKPLNPGLQHTQDHTEAFEDMFYSILVESIDTTENVVEQYKRALESPHSFLMVEYGELYNGKSSDA